MENISSFFYQASNLTGWVFSPSSTVAACIITGISDLIMHYSAQGAKLMHLYVIMRNRINYRLTDSRIKHPKEPLYSGCLTSGGVHTYGPPWIYLCKKIVSIPGRCDFAVSALESSAIAITIFLCLNCGSQPSLVVQLQTTVYNICLHDQKSHYPWTCSIPTHHYRWERLVLSWRRGIFEILGTTFIPILQLKYCDSPKQPQLWILPGVHKLLCSQFFSLERTVMLL